jgi:hypothetical protein
MHNELVEKYNNLKSAYLPIVTIPTDGAEITDGDTKVVVITANTQMEIS